MFTLLPEKLSTPDPSTPADLKQTVLFDSAMSNFVNRPYDPNSGSSLINICPEARAQWQYYCDLYACS